MLSNNSRLLVINGTNIVVFKETIIMKSKPEVIETQELRIVDQDGNLCGLFSAAPPQNTPILHLLDKEGRSTICMEVRADGGAAFAIRNPSLGASVGMGASPNGRIGIGVTDKGGRPVLEIGVNEDGSRVIIFFDSTGNHLLRLQV